MADRKILHTKLVEILGSNNVYFQPPENLKLKYPCIEYHRTPMDIKYANDKAYIGTACYQLTYMDKNPDSEIPMKLIENLSMIRHSNYFSYENLNHDVFTVYY